MCKEASSHVLLGQILQQPDTMGGKAREELTDQCIKTGVNPATQLTRAGTPASLKEDIEVEHALDVFYADMTFWKLGVGKEAQVLGYACLKFIEILRRKCLSKSITPLGIGSAIKDLKVKAFYSHC